MVSFGGQVVKSINLGSEAISTLEIRIFKVGHMGFSNI
jgi:hypothetical protein